MNVAVTELLPFAVGVHRQVAVPLVTETAEQLLMAVPPTLKVTVPVVVVGPVTVAVIE